MLSFTPSPCRLITGCRCCRALLSVLKTSSNPAILVSEHNRLLANLISRPPGRRSPASVPPAQHLGSSRHEGNDTTTAATLITLVMVEVLVTPRACLTFWVWGHGACALRETLGIYQVCLRVLRKIVAKRQETERQRRGGKEGSVGGRMTGVGNGRR